MRRRQVAVVGSPSAEALAGELGRGLVDAGYRVVCGGPVGGVMEAAARGARSSARATGDDVIGILPSADPNEAGGLVDEAIPTGLGPWWEGGGGNALVAAKGDAVVAVGMKEGTMVEIGLTYTGGKTVVAVRGADPWTGCQVHDVVRGHKVTRAASAAEALAHVACAFVPGLAVRPEAQGDKEAIARVAEEAFTASAHGHHGEAGLIGSLRDAGALASSLVAVIEGAVVGHVGFSPVTLDGASCGWLGMAPVSVQPAHQGRGIGTALCLAGLFAIRDKCQGCVVLGDLKYYGRFGFAQREGLVFPGGPPEHFGATAWSTEGKGVVAYHPAFEGL